MKRVHFSLGPVQSFVSQARRTRDLWAGSFMLSYLTALAMHEVLVQGGEVLAPHVHDGGDGDTKQVIEPLVKAIMAVRAGEAPTDPPAVGTAPNRFQANLPPKAAPGALALAVVEGWQRIAAAVWQRFVEPVAGRGDGTKAIWERQVESFWDIVWVVDDRDDALDRRKNWRTHVPAVEPGDKCLLISNMQELSGYVRAHDRTKQDGFWQALRDRVQTETGSPLELAEAERLCSIALIKRLFIYVARDAIGWALSEQVRHFPSTSYLAAVPWLAYAAAKDPHGALAYGERALAEGCGSPNRPARFQMLGGALEPVGLRRFVSLDGNLYFPEFLAARLGEDDAELPAPVARALLQELSRLQSAIGRAPSPYYAILLMDGDSLGTVGSELARRRAVSAGLARFQERAGVLEKAHSMVEIYRGGDDLLALLPLTAAIPAALALREAYMDAMQGVTTPDGQPLTISAAIGLVHCREPLRAALTWLHGLLDGLAKDVAGRNALAIGQWQRGGPAREWAGTWDQAAALLQLRDAFGSELGDREYSAGFFYKLDEVFALSQAAGDDLLVPLLTAEYVRTRERGSDGVTSTQLEQRMQLVKDVATPLRRPDGPHRQRPDGMRLASGPLIVKFLGQESPPEVTG